MATTKRIIKISKEEHDRLKRDYGHTFDLYFQVDQHYVIGDLKDLKAAGGSRGARNPDSVVGTSGKTFREVWEKAAIDNRSGFEDSQAGYISTSNFRPAFHNIQKKTGIDISEKGSAVQDAIWSTSTQYGPGLTGSIVRDAVKGKDLSTLTDAELIDAIQEVKRDKVDSHFSSSVNKSEWLPFTDSKGRTKVGLRQSLLNRIEEERLVLLRLA